jgi:serum/glucocorticoid-regulated kinase 2
LITNEAVYNISGKKIKRKIPIECVYGVTISRRSSEFVIHIPEEYDYRYDSKKSPEVRDLMVHYLVLAFKLKMKSGLRFYFVENEELE